MIALYSRWKLKHGCPPEFAAALDTLAAAVRNDEPGTLLYTIHLPAPPPPIGPPPDYAICDDPDDLETEEPSDLVFFEIYRDAEAFAAHLRGAVSSFMEKNRDYFVTPWQGHPKPETLYLDPRSVYVREALLKR